MKTFLSRWHNAGRLLPALAFFLLLGSFGTLPAWAQSPTPGLIFKPATSGTPGKAVLDPNGDGYVSATAAGFTTVAGDLGSQSEIPYKYLPQRSLEPMTDLRVGPSNKFTDFADVTGGGSSVGFYVDANNNYLFRFRLGGAAPNSKGYSIAIDTDNKFGFTGPNADPNAVAHNPGFEMEIELATNFGVRLFNIDGTTSPTGSAADGSLVELPYASYAQKSIAVTTNGGDTDVFYDFYIPLSIIQGAFGSQTFFNSTGATAVPFSLTTSLRMVANTIIAPHSVMQYQNISDVGGINDASYANPDNAFIELVTGAAPTSGAAAPTTTGNTLPARSAAPVVNSPIQSGATSVSGTSTEAAGTVITVYVNGSALGTTTTVQSGGAWTLTGITALANGALVKATATATGKTESPFSNEVQVAGSTVCATAVVATPTCIDPKGVYGPATPNYWVYLRNLDGSLVSTTGLTSGTKNPVQANASGTYILSGSGGSTTNCGSGQSAGLAGSYLITQSATNNITTPGSSCESAGTQICVGTSTAATPVVTTAKPITPSTTSLSGTATAGASVLLYVDGVRYSAVTATGGNYTFSTASSTLPTLTAGRTLAVYAAANGTSCISATAVTLKVVAARTVVPPVVNGPITAGVTVVSGTSNEAAGSVITLSRFANATGTAPAAATFSATVLADGTWSVTVPATVAGNSFSATVTPADYGTSAVSNVVPVQAPAATPTISGTYTEGATSVTGTGTAGTIITVYEDGAPLLDGSGNVLTVTVPAGGTWTLAGLSNGSGVSPNTAYLSLYAGGVLTAIATTATNAPSVVSNAATVSCPTVNNKTFATSPTCQNNAGTFTVSNVDPGVIYTLQDVTSGTAATTGTSQVGTGTGTSSLAIPTAMLSTPGTYQIRLNAFTLGATSCQSTSATTVPLVVNPLPVDKSTSADQSSFSTANTGTNINVVSSETGVTYQLLKTSVTPNTAVGTSKTGTGSNLAFPTGPVTSTATYAVSAVTPNTCARTLSQAQTIAYSGPLPVELTAFGVVARHGGAQLSWHTASELNSDHFEIERSLDGHNYLAIGQVAGQGTTAQPHSYSFTDAGSARLGKQLYYRLRLVDIDRTTSYSPVRVADFTAATLAAKVHLYPNPTSADVTIDLTQLPTGLYTVRVLSLTGQLLSSAELTTGQEHDLPVSSLPAGLYVVQVQSSSLHLTQSLVKLH
ncbi:MAG: T9SS type A sorting domain-containing protein [Janthinobacterium lividum]